MSHQPSRPTVIVVEDDTSVRRALQLLLHWRGFDVRTYDCVARALGSDRLNDAQMVVADYRLPDGNGLGFLHAMKRRGWSGRAVLITGYPDAALKDAAIAEGYQAVLEKPLRQHELVDLLGR
jgi:FixJ family two-component response regulator